MIKIYGSGPSRWAKCVWALRELDVPHEEIKLNMVKERDHMKPEFRKLNPFSKAPAMIDGDTVLFESSAILNYLGEKYAPGKMIPAAATPQRAQYDQWMFFAVTELERPLWHWFRHSFFFGDGRKSEMEIESSAGELIKILETLNTEMGSREYLVDNQFTNVDITMAYTLNWAKSYDFLAGQDNLIKYTERHCARPSFPSHLYS